MTSSPAPVVRTDPSRIADAVTEVFAPGVMNIALSLAVGWHTSWPGPGGLGWGLVAAAATGIVPYGWIIAASRRGRLGDRHVRERAERSGVLVMILASVSTGLALAITLHAPHPVTALLITMLVLLVLIGAITHYARWKISFHTAVAAGAASILSLDFGPALAATLLLVPLIGWARVRRRDHTTAQTIAGALLGALVTGLAYGALR